MRYSWTLIAILFCHIAVGQNKGEDINFKAKFAKATSLMFEDNYLSALPYLLELDSLEKENYNVDFLVGLSYLMSPFDAEKALPYLESAAAHTTINYRDAYYKEKNAPVDAIKYLGQNYHLTYQFDLAIATYENFKSKLDPEDEISNAEIDHLIGMTKTAQQLTSAEINMTITNVGGKINSEYADYAPLLTADESTMIFTSRRKGSTGGMIAPDGKYFEDIYISERSKGEWSEPVSIGTAINTPDHEATIGLAVDGQELLIYKFDVELRTGDIYFSKLFGDTWTVPQKLGSDINTEFWETHACISADGQYLFFVSDRPEGMGGRDIYFCKKLPNGEWGLAQNIGAPINTPYDEEAPFMHPDGKTLFYSSNGPGSMGGFDIMFSSKMKDNTWDLPMNIGYPVNTTGNDVFFTPTTDGKRAYYSSFRNDGFGDQDIYMITFPDQAEKPLTVYKGIVKDSNGEVPQDVFISVTDNVTGEIIGEYVPNSSTGKYLFILQPGGNYNITYEAEDYLFHSENLVVPDSTNYYEINKAIALEPIVVGATIVLENLFFEYDAATLLRESETEIEHVYKVLRDNPTVRIEISGHTDSKGADDYNQKLSQERAQAVVDYLVNQGIDRKRLDAKGYGEKKPIAPNLKPDGSDNPEGRALNRRTELTVVAK